MPEVSWVQFRIRAAPGARRFCVDLEPSLCEARRGRCCRVRRGVDYVQSSGLVDGETPGFPLGLGVSYDTLTVSRRDAVAECVQLRCAAQVFTRVRYVNGLDAYGGLVAGSVGCD